MSCWQLLTNSRALNLVFWGRGQNQGNYKLVRKPIGGDQCESIALLSGHSDMLGQEDISESFEVHPALDRLLSLVIQACPADRPDSPPDLRAR